MVDKALITKKLERVGSYLEQVHKIKDPGMAAFLMDRDIQSIILFNLIQAIQSCIDIGAHVISDSQWETPATQAELFEILAENKVITKSLAGKMIQMAGFRNRIVHEYEKTDMKIVHTIWKKHLTDIERYCKAVVMKYNL